MNNRYLLDTDALIDFAKKRDPFYSVVNQLIQEGADIGISPINIAEFYSGLSEKAHEVWDAFFESLLFYPISLQTAKRAGQFRYEFARKGISLSTSDTLIAAVAIEQRATLITQNVKDYPMKDLTLYPLP